MNRRSFLSAALAAPLGAGLRPRVRVGAHVWIFAAGQPDYDPSPVIEDAFRQYSTAGLDGIELMHQVLLHEGAVDRIGALSSQYKLPVTGTSWSAPMWDRKAHVKVANEAEAIVNALAALKGQTLGISVGDAGRRKTPGELDAQADMLRQVMQMCRPHKIRPNLHNHVYEVRDSEYDLQGTLERVPDAKLGPDVAWLYRAGISPVGFLNRYADRIVFLHLRDETSDHKWPEAIGEGAIDFKALGAALHGMSFSGDLVIELAHERGFVPTRPFGDSVKASREYIRQVMRY